MALLTKSNYLEGLQCPKLLWVSKNNKERIPEPDEIQKQKFEDGNKVGEIAKKAFPNGIDLSKESNNFNENILKTKEYLNSPELKEQVPLFEPGFKVHFNSIKKANGGNNIFSRADILVPVLEGFSEDEENQEWDIIEVKMSTKVKDINIHDLAFQRFVYEKAGLKIRKCFIMHVNNQFVLDNFSDPNHPEESITPERFFIKEDVSEDVEEYSSEIEKRIEKMFEIINSPQEPSSEIGTHCSDPYDCSLKTSEECWSNIPKENVLELYRMKKGKCFELYNRGIKKLNQLPQEEEEKLNKKQKLQKSLTEKENQYWKNEEKIKKFLDKLDYPLYYLDFETFNPVIPRHNGMKPYQRIPFQFSLHIQNSPKDSNEELKHISFLSEGKEDPRKKFLQSLKENLGKEGSIIVYNQGFEKSVMRESVEAFPEFKTWYEENIEPRIVDLMEVFKNFHFYHKDQKGSASIKYVLPIFSNLNYNEMDINKGDKASYEFERVIHRENVDEGEKKKILKELEEYCKLDTLAEFEIVKGLKNITEEK